MATKSEGTNNQFFSNIGDSLKNVRSTFSEVRETAGENRRKIGLKVIDHAQENAQKGFEAWRAVLEAKTIADAFKIQQDAVRSGFERNVKQVREVVELVTEANRASFEPIRSAFSRDEKEGRKAA